jgi:TonB-linked SusC/RagA family outer membrane protein
MNKFTKTCTLLLFAFLPILLFAQNMVTGKIVNQKNAAVPNATVTIKGARKSTQTDANGNFKIEAAKNDVLIITSATYFSKTVKVQDESNYVVTLQSNDQTLDVVVVTAMDQKKGSRELTHSTPTIDGDDIKDTQRENFLNGLQGRVAGVSITPTSGNAGASTNIVLRGYNSLALSNQPLFVIDGVIVDNSTLDENSSGGTGLGLASDRTNRNNDYTNRVSDLNPNDIESYTILKGPEATALYGSQASSGAIIITTKKAKLLEGKRVKIGGITYDNSFRFQEAVRFPEMYTEYGMGTGGRIDSNFAYFGPKLAPGTKQKNQFKEFFRTGVAQTHNLVVDFGNKSASFKLSGSFFNNDGVVPENNYKRYTLRATANLKLSKYFDILPSYTYTHSKNDKPIRGTNGYMTTLMRWPTDADISRAYNADGTKYELFPAGDPNDEFDNPYWNVLNVRSFDILNKHQGTLGINIYPTKWLTVNGRFGIETNANDGWSFYHPESQLQSFASRGSQDNYYRKYQGYNHNITATARKTYKKFEGRLMVGTSWQDYKQQAWSVTGNGIADPTTRAFDPKLIGDSNITLNTSRNSLYRNITFRDYNFVLNRQLAFFGEFALNWKKMIFVNYTHRFEQGSNLPEVNRNVNYPAGGVSLILSDLLPFLKNKTFNYVKLRGSLASTARSNSPYSNQSAFTQQTSSGGGFAYGFTNNNFFLEPEKQATYETGLELRMFKNKLSIDATYYNTKNSDQILELVRTSYGTGFILNTLNLSSTRNEGVEISTSYKWKNTKDFSWTTTLNFNKMWNQLLTLPSNLSEFYISDTWLYANARAGLVRGGPTTSITGYGYLRNNNGDILIDPTTGLPLQDQNFRVRGDRNPDFTLGINNNLRIGDLSVSMLWDVRVGGDIFNGNELFLTTIGRSKYTANRETPQIVNGVLRDGFENTATPTKNNIVINPYLNNTFYTSSTVYNEEFFIEKNINALRLRDVTFNYNLQKVLKNRKVFKGLNAYVTANNLILLSNYSGADPAINGTTPGTRGVGAFGFDYGTVPEPISVNIGIKASF